MDRIMQQALADIRNDKNNGKGTINGDAVLVYCEECEKLYWKER